MILKEYAQCENCWKKHKKRVVCFKIEVSRLEAFLNIEKFECESCHHRWVIKSNDGR